MENLECTHKKHLQTHEIKEVSHLQSDVKPVVGHRKPPTILPLNNCNKDPKDFEETHGFFLNSWTQTHHLFCHYTYVYINLCPSFFPKWPFWSPKWRLLNIPLTQNKPRNPWIPEKKHHFAPAKMMGTGKKFCHSLWEGALFRGYVKLRGGNLIVSITISNHANLRMNFVSGSPLGSSGTAPVNSKQMAFRVEFMDKHISKLVVSTGLGSVFRITPI